MLKNELQLAGLIREKLTPDFKKVYSNVNPASSKFYPHWEEWFGQPVPCAQPQIDLLLVDSRLWLLAVELKYFRKTKGKISHPFYAGIGEALALLRFGFMVVSLWHFFDDQLALEETEKLRRSCSQLIQSLELPIEYSGVKIEKGDAQIQFRQLYADDSEAEGLPSPYGRSNPFRSNIDSQRIQDFLRNALKIPLPR
jgi:hypothetical protein